MAIELLDVFDRIDEDDAVRAVIVTGRGRAFCAGADLSLGAQTFDYDSQRPRRPGPLRAPGRRWDDHPAHLRLLKPIIAAINGPAVGVGITMTLAMDVRLAADDARMGFVFARRGIVPEACSSWFLPRIVGIDRALEWAYRGDVFPATEALAGGLVRSLHPADELLAVAQELADDHRRQHLGGLRGPDPADDVADARRGPPDGGPPGPTPGPSTPPAAPLTPWRVSRPSWRSAPPCSRATVTEDLPDVFPEWEQPEFR